MTDLFKRRTPTYSNPAVWAFKSKWYRSTNTLKVAFTADRARRQAKLYVEWVAERDARKAAAPAILATLVLFAALAANAKRDTLRAAWAIAWAACDRFGGTPRQYIAEALRMAHAGETLRPLEWHKPWGSAEHYLSGEGGAVAGVVERWTDGKGWKATTLWAGRETWVIVGTVQAAKRRVAAQIAAWSWAPPAIAA